MINLKSLPCVVLNFIQRRNVLDTFDRYVVLAFFLTGIITIIVCLLLVKYFTYNIYLDKQRQQFIAKRKMLPLIKEDDSVDNSEDEEWCESSGEDDHQMTSNNEGSECLGTVEDLQTNYVNSSKVLNEEDSEIKVVSTDIDNNDLGTKWFETWIKPDLVLTDQMKQPHIFTDVFQSEKSEISFSILRLYRQQLLQILNLRKIGFIQLLNFTVDMLFHERTISQDQALPLKAKFEQQYERACFNTDGTNGLSTEIVQIIRDFLKDLKELSVERKTIEQVLSQCLSQPLNCLKIYMLSIPEFSKLCTDNYRNIVNGVAAVEKTLLIVKSRYVFLKNTILNAKCPSKILADLDNEMKLIFCEFQGKVQQTLQSVSYFNLSDSTELSLKLEQSINTLKVDICNSKSNNVKKLEAFGDGITCIFIKHLESCGTHMLSLNSKEITRVSENLQSLQKNVTLSVQQCEETLLIKIQETLKLQDDDISQLVNNVQNNMKDLLTTHNQLRKECDISLSGKQEKLTNFINLCINYTIKLVSSRYRIVLAANTLYIKSWPSLPERTLNKLEQSIRGKMAMVSFDVVFGLVFRLLMELEDKKYCLVDDFKVNSIDAFVVDCFEDGKLDTSDFIDRSVLKTSLTNVKPFNISQVMLENNLKEHYNIVMKAFDNLTDNLMKMLRSEVKTTCRTVFEENFEIYKKAQEKLTSCKRSQKTTTNNSQRYLSRKGSSFKEKSMYNELNDIYEGLVDVKEHRYREKIDELKLDSKPKAKDIGKSTCLKYLNMQTDFLQRTFEQKLPRFAFENEEYYMRETLMKKILKKGEQIEEEEEEKRSMRSPVNAKSKNTKKSSLGPIKRRKSRKVSDLV